MENPKRSPNGSEKARGATGTARSLLEWIPPRGGMTSDRINYSRNTYLVKVCKTRGGPPDCPSALAEREDDKRELGLNGVDVVGAVDLGAGAAAVDMIGAGGD